MRAVFAGLLLASLGGAAPAAVPKTALARLDGDLTPVGAERAGNADGSIPAWQGGMTSPPAGWTASDGYIDPFPDEKPLFVISGANAEKYREHLSPGLLALLRRYPEFRMPVYPAHRTAAYPEAVTRRARAQAAAVQLDEETGIRNLGGSTIPFPLPQTGLEVIWNHLLRYMGGGVERSFDGFSVTTNGEYLKISFHDKRIFDENFDEHVDNCLFSYLGYFLNPPEMVGTVYLVHEPINPLAEPRKAWVYNAGQRRVRRAPELGYDNGQDGTNGMAIVDQYDGYNGAPDRYEWHLLGKMEIYVAYNSYKIGDKKLPYERILGEHTVDPNNIRYELHRVWVVEASLKPGKQHLYVRRQFYVDEDSWSVLLDDAYDSQGNLWRTGIHGLIQYYDVSVPWYRFELWHDLTNGAYVLTGLDNAYDQPWKFGVKGKTADFQPDSLRRLGNR